MDVTKIEQKLKYFHHTLKGLPRISHGVRPNPTDHCSRAWVGVACWCQEIAALPGKCCSGCGQLFLPTLYRACAHLRPGLKLGEIPHTALFLGS